MCLNWEIPQPLAQSTSSDCKVVPRVGILCGLEEKELRAIVHVDILPVVDWDNTRWDLAFCVFELRNPTAFSPVHLKWLYNQYKVQTAMCLHMNLKEGPSRGNE